MDAKQRTEAADRQIVLLTSNLEMSMDEGGQIHVYLVADCKDPQHKHDAERGVRFWWKVEDEGLRLPIVREFIISKPLRKMERSERLSMLARVLSSVFAPVQCPACSRGGAS